MQIKTRKSAKFSIIDGIENLHYRRNDEMKNKRSRTLRRKTAKLAEIMAEKLTEHRQIRAVGRQTDIWHRFCT